MNPETGRTSSQRRYGFDGAVEPVTEHEQVNDHLAHVYDDRDEQLATVVSFLRHGLESGEQCIYVTHETPRETVLEALRDAGVDVDTALETGAFEVVAAADAYQQSGAFDPDAALEFWREKLSGDVATDFAGVRTAAEMSWALDDPGTTNSQLAEYEALLNPFYAANDHTGLCQYNRTRFPDEIIDDVIETHPLIVQDGTVSQNVYYTPPEQFLDDQPEARVDRKLRTLRDRTDSRTTLHDHEQYLHELYEIIAATDRDFNEKLQALFEVGCERFDMELGGLAQVNPGTDRFEVEATSGGHPDLVPGAQYPLSETYCRATADDGGTCAVTDTDGYEDTLGYEEFDVHAYLGTYLAFDDAADRTFWFVSTEPRDEISQGERTFHHLMGQWVRYELEQRHQTDQFLALNNLNETARDINRALVEQSTQADVERVVCDRLAASDSYTFAHVATVENGAVTLTTDANVHDEAGERAERPGAQLVTEAVDTGTPQIASVADIAAEHEPLTAVEDDRGIRRLASIPVAYEDEQYGALTVATARERAFDETELGVLAQVGEIMGLALTVIDQQRTLEHERERMEFFNRLVRHNLQNDLSVVQARARIIADDVAPDATDHLEVIRSRLDEMSDLIDTLRSLMKAVLETGDTELEPVDLGKILDAELQNARQVFDDAEFDSRGETAAAGMVLADDLLSEVFENLLANAVEHNDKETPHVEVAVEERAETTTVRIADNGPGVPDDIKDTVFEKGVQGFDSAGTGFGLHLVREIVDGYDGEITVEDRQPDGTVFSLSLPRATAGEE
ncbi:MEDS domain-containing protein [Salarchaeum sp. III]|uniref:MEDS domain-containing protein n=1 Tax=Salarchaeum sp. III TaxID=3107927 RepID=UPI002ED7E4F3